MIYVNGHIFQFAILTKPEGTHVIIRNKIQVSSAVVCFILKSTGSAPSQSTVTDRDETAAAAPPATGATDARVAAWGRDGMAVGWVLRWFNDGQMVVGW